MILQKDVFGAPDVGYCHAVNAAYVKISFLELCSEYELNERREVHNDRGEFLYEGTLKDYFAAFGVEEAHHAIYRRYKGERRSSPPPALSLPLSTYDADETEFRALKWQLRHAEENHLPGVNAFTQRIEAARRVREQQQATRTLVQSLQEETQ